MKRKTSRLLATLLALCMALALLPGTAWAAASGPYDIPCPVTGGRLLFDSATGTVTDYDGDITEVVIPSEIEGVRVSKIGDSAFKSCSSLTSVTIPDGVTSIGNRAFDGCINLAGVTIPDSVTTIGEHAFATCKSLTGITIPDGVTSIAPHTFNYCNHLTSATIPDTVTYIGDHAFANCDKLADITIPDTVTYIGDAAFSGCDGLTAVTIPDTVSTISDHAFYGCGGLTAVTIPGGVTTIEESAFNNCSKLTSVIIPDSVATIEKNAFIYCRQLKDVYYGGSESQWGRLGIDKTGNSTLLGAAIHYNSTGPDVSTDTPSPDNTPVASGGTPVTVNGAAVVWTDAEPFIDENSRTLVPLRAVADAMGLDVNWDAAAREAIFTDGNKTIYFPIDSTTARTCDGGEIEMDTAAVIVNERTYAPIRYLAEYFGYTVGWDTATRTVIITG